MKQKKFEPALTPSVPDINSDLLVKYSDDFQKEIQPDDELLISWLDGELDDQECLLLEKKIANSPELHKRMEELRETWELLNTLKTDPVGPRLASSTMEMVALCADRECQTRKKRIRQKRSFVFIGIGLLLIGTLLAARFVTNVFVNRSLARIEQMTPFLIRLDQLETINDYDFLVTLADSALFKNYSNSNIEFVSSGTPPAFHNTEIFPESKENKTAPASSAQVTKIPSKKIVDNTSENVLNKTSEMTSKNIPKKESPLDSSEESATEQSTWNDPNFQRLVIKYHHLSSSKKKNLAELYQKIEESPRREELFKTAENYYLWLTTDLHEWQRDTIIYSSDNERLPQIKKCLTETKINPRTNRTANNFSSMNETNQTSYPPPFSKKFPLLSDETKRIFPSGLTDGPNIPPFPVPPQKKEINNRDPNSNYNQEKRNIQITNHKDSKIPPFFGKNSNVWNNLPEELRKEDLSSFFDSFDKYVNERMKNFTQKKDGRNKNAQSKSGDQGTGHPPWRGGFRLINDFISSQPINVFLVKLSPSARAYIEKLPEQERKRVLGLLFTFNLYGRWCPEVHDPKNKNFSRNAEHNFYPGNFHAPFDKNSQFNNGSNTKFNGAFWMNESTGELAETLRRLPKEKQDELLSLPSDEMYAQLLILHWGFDPKKVRKKTEEILPRSLPR